jgi:lysophospholipase L1-like esterase
MSYVIAAEEISESTRLVLRMTIARRLTLALLLVAAAVSAAGAQRGAAREHAGGPVFAAPGHYLLALGDSITFGMDPAKATAGAPPSAYDAGFVDVFAARLRAVDRSLVVVNYGCPGETTTSFIHGGCPWTQGGHGLHDGHAGTQLEAALAFLHAHQGQVSPIMLNLWGNDAAALSSACNDRIPCVKSRFPAALAQFQNRLNQILHALRPAAPGAEIIVTGDWNTYVPDLPGTDPLWKALDAAIARTAAGHGARFADPFPVFNPKGSTGAEKAAVCRLTLICSRWQDAHPSVAGYRALADVVYAASGYAKLKR